MTLTNTDKALKKARVVHREVWTAVKEIPQPDRPLGPTYDVWRWNIWKLKWTRLSNTACGFGTLDRAVQCAREMSEETQTMLDSNRQPPVPMP